VPFGGITFPKGPSIYSHLFFIIVSCTAFGRVHTETMSEFRGSAGRCVICLESLEPELSEDDSNNNADTGVGDTSAVDSIQNGIHRSRCGHDIHRQCLHASIRSGNYNCPVCRHPLGEMNPACTSASSNNIDNGSSSCSNSSSDGASSSNQPIVRGGKDPLDRYIRMLKSNLPPAVVRQRMVVDNIPASTIDAFFTGGVSREVMTAEEIAAEGNNARLKAIANLDTYRRQLKVGVDEGAVRQKMAAAGIAQSDIDDFFQEYMSNL
jgi:hypothetical protein